MRIGVHLPNCGPFASLEAIEKMAVTADRLGYDALLMNDHLNWGSTDIYHFYAGSVEAADAMDPPPLDFYATFATMGFLAGITRQIRLIPAALCLAWRHPLQVAREALTLYELSQHRFVLCVCGGNVKRDFDVTGVPWEARGKLTTESLKVLRAFIDSDGPFSFQGEYFRFEGADLYPRPKGMQLWYASTTDVGIRRAARYCEGYMPAAGPEYFREKAPYLKHLAEQYGRGSVEFELSVGCRSYVAPTVERAMSVARRTFESDQTAEWLKRHDIPDVSTTWLAGPPERIAEAIREFEKAGCTQIFIEVVAHSLDELIDQLEQFAGGVFPLIETDPVRTTT
jgi:alkanesulfonate monooxygenase SsuD/methylene tetrahydromethanopterin reductase-like flavin-dependent oxidoreductase (luciferase family)